MADIQALTSRAFAIEGYASPLVVTALDSGTFGAEMSLSRLFSVPNRHVLDVEARWQEISTIAERVLDEDDTWRLLAHNNPFRIGGKGSNWRSYRMTVTKLLRRIAKDPTYLAFLVASNSVYVASEGLDVNLDYTISIPSIDWFYDALASLLVRRVGGQKGSSVSRDDILLWKRVVRLAAVNPSPEFKQAFNPVLGYEIPFGLSPQTESDSLKKLISNAKNVALIPMIAGVHTTSTAISNGEWVVALKAASTSGAVVLVLLSTIAVADTILARTRK